MLTLRAWPQDVHDEVGYALYLAQIGEQHADAKPLKGLGPGVLEVIATPQSEIDLVRKRLKRAAELDQKREH
jgi:phage-related protein